ncbi:phosphate ABC transporter substrate-binding/OmpA family protein [Tranquillimonas alkanivorans]|uniref:Phosphate ABC transporter substrate-binding protein, PhoT family n=1 Tax=Tranquillimonas alkanivorans TaxID=441119 RepID=A0A1I5LAY7_9RHOB|nr:phosphate ABC transporter substrate-binding/OmpA family protein [Tranquillimonas alkanivorans]SFO94322.1 phosphate ABC transporter substrate-binding protein, PhoT family [Tranquillimonas alkanivorans]
MILPRAVRCVALILGLGAASAAAEVVELRSTGGGLSVSGELLGYDGAFYRILTEHGVLTLEGARVSCEGAACPDERQFVADATFSGARSMVEVLLPALVESFAARQGLTAERAEEAGQSLFLLRDDGGEVVGRFRLRAGSSAEGFADLVAEEADVAVSLREPTAQERAMAESVGYGDWPAARWSRIVALDGLVPLVSIANPVTEIDFNTLAALFAGNITNWADLGGGDAPVRLHLLAPDATLTQEFVSWVLEPAGLELSDAVTHHDNAATLAAVVAEDPNAIGIGTFSDIGNAAPVALAGLCGFTAEVTERTLKTEDYPLTAPLFLFLPPRRLPLLVQQFLAYATSPAAQPVVRRSGFVDQFPEAVPLDAQGLRFASAIARAGEDTGLDELQRMVAALSGRDRLTLTFRFENGSSELDAQSRSNVTLLARALERGIFDGRDMLFVGFSDGQGPASANRRLSRDRARTVRAAVEAALGAAALEPVRLGTDGFGEAMPMACDDSAWGRQINRRVEVWLK